MAKTLTGSDLQRLHTDCPSYPTIPHIKGSYLEGDRSQRTKGHRVLHETMSTTATHGTNPNYDIICTIKEDGKCMGVYKEDDQLYPIVRNGYLAETSTQTVDKIFALWVEDNYERFMSCLNNKEVLWGEWLAKPNSILYELVVEPFMVFDIHSTVHRKPLSWEITESRVKHDFYIACVHRLRLKDVRMNIHFDYENAQFPNQGFWIPTDGDRVMSHSEGFVWRVENEGAEIFKCKYIHPSKKFRKINSKWNINLEAFLPNSAIDLLED